MQPLEAIIVGGVIAIATGFLLWTFWPTTGRKKDRNGNPSPCATSSCGCASKDLATKRHPGKRDEKPRSPASTSPG